MRVAGFGFTVQGSVRKASSFTFYISGLRVIGSRFKG